MESLMIVKAIELRNKENLQKIKKVLGYYKWWAKRTELDIILTELNVKFDDGLTCSGQPDSLSRSASSSSA